MQDIQATNKQYHQTRKNASLSQNNVTQHPKGSARYHRIREYKQTETWKTISPFLALVVLAILLASLVQIASTAFTRPDVAALRQSVATAVLAQNVPSSNDSFTKEVSDFLRRVHRKESSSGSNTNPDALHNICRAKGQSNEYGYGGMTMMICFPSDEIAKETVANWYKENRPLMASEAMTYCYYALGSKHETCDYWEEMKNW